MPTRLPLGGLLCQPDYLPKYTTRLLLKSVVQGRPAHMVIYVLAHKVVHNHATRVALYLLPHSSLQLILVIQLRPLFIPLGVLLLHSPVISTAINIEPAASSLF